MIILGVILLIVGIVVDQLSILTTIGIVLIVVGIILELLGALSRPVLGRRHYW
jgi:membrane-bound ClpP family serine protease